MPGSAGSQYAKDTLKAAESALSRRSFQISQDGRRILERPHWLGQLKLPLDVAWAFVAQLDTPEVLIRPAEETMSAAFIM